MMPRTVLRDLEVGGYPGPGYVTRLFDLTPTNSMIMYTR